MQQIIDSLFDMLAVGFDKIPGVKKIKGARTLLGLLGLAIVFALQANGVGPEDFMDKIKLGFSGFIMLAMNAKGRSK